MRFKPLARAKAALAEGGAGAVTRELRELGMSSPEADRAMMEAALVGGEIRNAELQPVWDGSEPVASSRWKVLGAKASIPSAPVGF